MSNLHLPCLLRHQPMEDASLCPLKPIENPCDEFTLATNGDGAAWVVKCWCRGIESMMPPQLLQLQYLPPDVSELMEDLFKFELNKDSNCLVLYRPSSNLNSILQVNLYGNLWKHDVANATVNIANVNVSIAHVNVNISVDKCN